MFRRAMRATRVGQSEMVDSTPYEGEQIPVRKYRLEVHSHYPADEHHNVTVARAVEFAVPADEILETIKIVRTRDDGNWETVTEFAATDPARNMYPFLPRVRPFGHML